MSENLVNTPEYDSHARSAELLEAAKAMSDAVMIAMPEVCGVTAFGSAVRGEAGPQSDLDACVLIESSELPPQLAESQGKPTTLWRDKHGTICFDFMELVKYVPSIKGPLDQKGVESDIWVLPINEAIITEATGEALDIVRAHRENPNMGGVAPKNLRALFHAPIADRNLDKYRKQVLEQLEHEGELGEHTWRMIRFFVGVFEAGKHPDTNPDAVNHRYIPATIEEARGYYFKEP